MKELGAILLTNLVINTDSLAKVQGRTLDFIGEEIVFGKMSSHNLYARMQSDINLNKLDKSEQIQFLCVDNLPNSDEGIKKMYGKRMSNYMKEVHSRTAKNLGVSPTKIIPFNFSENNELNNDACVIYDAQTDNIYINTGKNYLLDRPTKLVEGINYATNVYAIHKNIYRAIASPNEVNDRDYFVALITAVKTYIYETLRKNEDDSYTPLIAGDYCLPHDIESTIFALGQTRKDYQQAGLYGGILRKELREAEESFYDTLQNGLLEDSLYGVQDILDFFTASELNKQSGNMLAEILKELELRLAPDYFNSLGAKMEKGQSIDSYLEELKNEALKQAGLDHLTGEDWSELFEIQKQEKEAMAETLGYLEEDEYFEEIDDEECEFDDEELEDALEELEEELEDELEDEGDGINLLSKLGNVDYHFKNILPKEGKVNDISNLPFHGYEEKEKSQE